MRGKRYSWLVVGLILLVVLLSVTMLYAQTQTANITVDVNTNSGTINRGVISSAMARSTNLEGVWDLNNNRPFPEMVAYAKGMGMKFLRYAALEQANWKTAVGPNRTTEFGLPEFLKFCEASVTIPIIIVSEQLQFGTSADAADLVEYLNAPNNGSNPNGGIDWASVRAGDGHPEPWNVVWFEYGNESWGLNMPANTYVINYINYRNAMRQTMREGYPTLTDEDLNDRLKLGAVLGNYFWEAPRSKWNAEVIPGTGSVADFYIIHTYIPAYTKTCCNEGDNICLTTSLWGDNGRFYPELCTFPADYVFQSGLSGVNDQLENYLNQLNSFIHELTGRNIGIAITEFNGHFGQHWYLPSAYRHSLGDALINAEFIRQFMHTDHIVMSNFWQFANDYWGMVVGPNSMPGEEDKAFGKRPNYYPFYFYHNYFGDTLIDVDTDVPAYEEEGFYDVNGNFDYEFGVLPASANAIQHESLDANILNQNWTISPVPDADANDSGGVLTVNLNGSANVDYDDSQITVNIESNTRYRLSGLIKTNNLSDGEEAYLAVQTSGVNLIADSGFENTTAWSSNSNDNWSFNPNSDSVGLSTDIDPSTSFSDTKSAYVNFSGNYDNNFYHVASAPINVQPNTAYTLEGYIKTDNINYQSTNEWYGIMLSVVNILGCQPNPLDYECWGLSMGLKGTHDWTRVSKNFKTKSQTSQVKVQLRRMSGGGNISGEAWWDDLKLSEKITTESLSGTSDWRYVYVDFNTQDLNNPSSLTILAGGNARGDGIQDKYAQFKDVKLRKITQNARRGKTPYLSVNASKSTDGNKVYLMVVNKDMVNNITATINLNNFIPVSAQARILNGPTVYATNEIDPNNVHVTDDNIGPVTNPFTYSFQPHSLTALAFYTNNDGDDYTSEVDCNDNDSAINPVATEICDGIDNNCNGQIDEGVQNTYYRDADGDGYGDPGNKVDRCDLTPPPGYVSNNLDCDDNNASVKNDGVDTDNDGYTTCRGDCDDNNSQVNPGMPERLANGLDDDCNPATSDSFYSENYDDGIADGWIPQLGYWEVINGKYKGRSYDDTMNYSILSSSVTTDNMVIETDMYIENVGFNRPRIYFDYQSDTDYKYIYIDGDNWWWDIGYRDTLGMHRIARNRDYGVATEWNYHMKIKIISDTVELYLDNSSTPMLTAQFDTAHPIGNGKIGYGVSSGVTYFDNLALYYDSDEDGYTADADCDDSNASVNPEAADNNCNGIDENCDGTADNNYVPTATSCGVGVCASTGQMICTSGVMQDNCTPNPAGVEGPIGDMTCSDLADNDCDGTVDNADINCVETNLVGHWTLDNVTMGTGGVADSSGNGLHGSIVNNVTCNTPMPPAQTGKACTFNGSSNIDYISVPRTNSIMDFPLESKITLSAWVKPSGFPALGNYSTVMIRNNYGIQLKTKTAGTSVVFFFRDITNQYLWHEYHTDEQNLVLNATYHIAVTYTYGHADTAKVYVNGSELTGSWVNGNGNAAPYVFSDAMKIGATGGGEEWNGMIDDVRIYSRELSGPEVSTLYTAGSN